MAVCLNCGEPLKALPSEIRKGRKFCSRSCYDAYRSRTTKTCPSCGKEFKPNKNNQKFCSRECYNTFRAQKKPVVYCLECGALVRYGKKYCSSSCANKARGRLISKKVELICENCGKKYKVPPHEAKRSRFCSASCRSHWVATHTPRSHKKIIESHGYRFVRVGPKQYVPEHIKIWEDVFGPIPEGYIVHHKNNDPSDNKLENLELLNRSEHMALHNSKTHPNLLSNKMESYIKKLQYLADILGRAPTKKEVNAVAGLPPVNSFKKYFGSWKATLNHIGLNPLPPGSGAQKIKLKAKSSRNSQNLSGKD